MNSSLYRSIFVLSGLVLILVYSKFQKSVIDDYFTINDEYILKNLPNQKLFTSEEVDNPLFAREFLAGSNAQGLYVHFWATWCGPCEKELPEFLEFADSFSEMGVSFLIVAVKDNQKEVQKFIKKFNISKNVTIAYDPKGDAMREFGTLRVPETYLFKKDFSLLKKFVGPQDWLNPHYLSNSVYLLKLN